MDRKETTTISTYGEYFEETDRQDELFFFVPTEWLTKVVAEEFGMPLEEFLNWYTLDNTESIYNTAVEEGVIISEYATEGITYMEKLAR